MPTQQLEFFVNRCLKIPAVSLSAGCVALLSISSLAQTRAAYERSIEEMPAPTNQMEHERACRDLRVESARQRSLAAGAHRVASGAKLAEFEMSGQRNAALLDSKADQFRCSEPFQTTATKQEPFSLSPIQQCISACKENTSRTGEQCFDSCNK